jgi:hypothetical protein
MPKAPICTLIIYLIVWFVKIVMPKAPICTLIIYLIVWFVKIDIFSLWSIRECMDRRFYTSGAMLSRDSLSLTFCNRSSILGINGGIPVYLNAISQPQRPYEQHRDRRYAPKF